MQNYTKKNKWNKKINFFWKKTLTGDDFEVYIFDNQNYAVGVIFLFSDF